MFYNNYNNKKNIKFLCFIIIIIIKIIIKTHFLKNYRKCVFLIIFVLFK